MLSLFIYTEIGMSDRLAREAGLSRKVSTMYPDDDITTFKCPSMLELHEIQNKHSLLFHDLIWFQLKVEEASPPQSTRVCLWTS